MRLPMLACGLVFALGDATLGQDPNSRRPVLVEYQAECRLTPEILDQLLIDVLIDEKEAAVDALLVEHEVEHGWSCTYTGPDFIDDARAVRCSTAVLDRMAVLRMRDPDVWPWQLHGYFAIALQRAGRLDQALAMLDATAVATVKDKEEFLAEMVASNREAGSASIAARLCARAKSWERALEYAKRWQPTSGCGTCDEYERSSIQSFRARMLAQLGRFDDSLAITRTLSGEQFVSTNAFLIAAWIDDQLRNHPLADVGSAVQAVRESTKAGESAASYCEDGKRLWDLRHAPRAEQLEHLGELQKLDEDFVLSLVFGLDNPAVEAHLAAFDVVENRLRDYALADLLASTGNPRLRSTIERASEKLGDEVKYVRETWETAQRRWVALANKR